ncbi:hypothetical protein Val02_29670 [Virgisporangium aliadipatigenens]|uniref:DUF4097 domain-containing protein n=1 Tax=Virgisporangium aliadipatigenens TaxID=741659 RepID=A0A8J3YJ54_9ACTN|nr:DUF4097 family beta strand repeat-containing protein [Virgisporangium aliadipatigenens]GIJ46081.1 hypothetical protein Val02_29670 [Virgisporangium aliadipatigenens]
MPTYTTPDPIRVTVDLSVGDVRFVASDRADTVVDVRPSNAADDSDVQAARQTRVEFADGGLSVRGPRRPMLDLSRRSRAVTIVVELPTGSAVHGEVAVGDVDSSGVLGESRFRTSAGHFRLDRTGPLRLSTTGHVTVGAVAGDAEIATGSGRVRIGTVTGPLRVRSADGDISVERAESGVDAKTSNGTVRLG